jgi:hypothetical protein
MKLRMFIFILVIGLAMAAGSARAQVPDLIIYPAQLAEDEVVIVDPGQAVGVGIDWDACRKALVDIAERVSHINLWLDNLPWPPSNYAERADLMNTASGTEKETFDCMGHTDVIHGFAIIYGLGVLPPGDHPVHIIWRFDHPVPSGADEDGDGRPEIYRGILMDRTIILRVPAP